MNYSRRKTSTTMVGGLAIGSDYPIRIQTMANTSTNDVEASVAQAKRCMEAGAELLRYTTQGMREVENLKLIHAELAKEGINGNANGVKLPLVADIHFRSEVADAAAQVVEKVRVNPGNYASEDELEQKFIHFLDICKEHHTAIRIGVNHGSLSKRMMAQYGDTPEGIVASCMEFLRIAVKQDFHDIVLSVKASNTRVMVDSVRLLVRAMDAEDMHFPLHLGVTEAGEGEDGRIKSAVGIGALLADGIGDTIRVSLSEEPEAEIPVAIALRDYFADEKSVRYNGVNASVIEIDTNNTPGSMNKGANNTPDTKNKGANNTPDSKNKGANDTPDSKKKMVLYSSDVEDWGLFSLQAAAECGHLLWDNGATELELTNAHFEKEMLEKLANDILQAARIRMYKTDYISCPGCGRTMFDLQKTVAEIKKAIAEIADPELKAKISTLKIGVMGCIVNGPGEMSDADFGYVGAGLNRISLYKGQECVEKNIPQEEAVAHLLEIIRKW